MGEFIRNAMGKGLTPLVVSPDVEPPATVTRIDVAGPDEASALTLRVGPKTLSNGFGRDGLFVPMCVLANPIAIPATVVEEFVGAGAEVFSAERTSSKHGVRIVDPFVFFDVAVGAEKPDSFGKFGNLSKDAVAMSPLVLSSVDVMKVQRGKATTVPALLATAAKQIDKRLFEFVGICLFHITSVLFTGKWSIPPIIPLTVI